MLFHWREYAKVTLYASVVVVTDVILNHVGQFLLAGESLSVVPFPLEDPPETFHRAVVDTLGYTGHTLRHTRFFQLVMERAVCVLEPPVAMEQRVRVEIFLYRSIKGLENQRIVVAVADHIGDDAAVVEIQNRAEINLVYLNAFIPLELCHIREPFFIRPVCVKSAIQKILGYVLGSLRLSCAATVVILDGGLDTFCSTDSENAFVVHMDMLVVPEVIVDAAVALVWTLHMNLLDFLRYLLILQCSGALLTRRPTVIGRSRNMQYLAGFFDRSRFLYMALLNGSVKMSLSYL